MSEMFHFIVVIIKTIVGMLIVVPIILIIALFESLNRMETVKDLKSFVKWLMPGLPI